MDVDYPDQSGEYVTQESFRGKPVTLSISDSLQQVMVQCPNGRTYNLSCALRNANLDYFFLIPEQHEKLLLELQSYFLKNTSKELLLANKLKKNKDEHAIFKMEEIAIETYTTSEYRKLNSLLRGNEIDTYDQKPGVLKKLIVTALLGMSGVNKNIHTEKQAKNTVLNRLIDGNLPRGQASEMLMRAGLQRTTGFTSFSADTKGSQYFSHRPMKIEIKDEGSPGSQCSIVSISTAPVENETLLPTVHLQFNSESHSEKLDEADRSVFKAKIVRGPITETTEHYFSELALCEAYEKHLKNPYKDNNSTKGSIHRPNHALAHHCRVMAYMDDIIEYFKKHAKDEEFKKFCETLTHHDIEIIKILLAFSKTGRESEIAFPDNPTKYQEYQNASCDNMTQFMKNFLSPTDSEIDYYYEILQYMGNPDFSTKATGTTDEKQKKIFINHLITLAHKLDLPRCYSSTQWESALNPYQSDETMIQLSEKQRSDFETLKELAICAILETGDESLVHSSRDVKDPAQFISCNKNVYYCLDRIQLAHNITSTETLERKRQLKMIDSYSRYQKIHQGKKFSELKNVDDLISYISFSNPDNDEFIKIVNEFFKIPEKKNNINMKYKLLDSGLKISQKKILLAMISENEKNLFANQSKESAKIILDIILCLSLNDITSTDLFLMIEKYSRYAISNTVTKLLNSGLLTEEKIQLILKPIIEHQELLKTFYTDLPELSDLTKYTLSDEKNAFDEPTQKNIKNIGKLYESAIAILECEKYKITPEQSILKIIFQSKNQIDFVRFLSHCHEKNIEIINSTLLQYFLNHDDPDELFSVWIKLKNVVPSSMNDDQILSRITRINFLFLDVDFLYWNKITLSENLFNFLIKNNFNNANKIPDLKKLLLSDEQIERSLLVSEEKLKNCIFLTKKSEYPISEYNKSLFYRLIKHPEPELLFYAIIEFNNMKIDLELKEVINKYLDHQDDPLYFIKFMGYLNSEKINVGNILESLSPNQKYNWFYVYNNIKTIEYDPKLPNLKPSEKSQLIEALTKKLLMHPENENLKEMLNTLLEKGVRLTPVLIDCLVTYTDCGEKITSCIAQSCMNTEELLQLNKIFSGQYPLPAVYAILSIKKNVCFSNIQKAMDILIKIPSEKISCIPDKLNEYLKEKKYNFYFYKNDEEILNFLKYYTLTNHRIHILYISQVDISDLTTQSEIESFIDILEILTLKKISFHHAKNIRDLCATTKMSSGDAIQLIENKFEIQDFELIFSDLSKSQCRELVEAMIKIKDLHFSCKTILNFAEHIKKLDKLEPLLNILLQSRFIDAFIGIILLRRNDLSSLNTSLDRLQKMVIIDDTTLSILIRSENPKCIVDLIENGIKSNPSFFKSNAADANPVLRSLKAQYVKNNGGLLAANGIFKKHVIFEGVVEEMKTRVAQKRRKNIPESKIQESASYKTLKDLGMFL
ncbi:MAG: hypothetical protein A3I77_05430 [Gammaproteobacteria bacterium RIFCSPLOWO2_02_FULL_42_14]|nr:MAG: hypothetical protein A3B71_01995 [Gammaproteobacteria bacterium RIFCSPHIGHO2_02_FULL_42_43]OGT51213.1 MAG: hypothetical protein A3E54_03185 [Gammaproteobacteria bacterium RIFCSPHIGHO2_12_FULL_41_25]OGT62974.1 MAG: hypothetical protein A3I77_05430 [Gammaproteobacteria bacterium RIFCSPLOWO2_02_FULL_42_14]OGT86107.1 MAG: hypothetical protein A3G86_02985 [Gammaproteobacteria bacterium RIFCSPLOWO2_12_FULL_42_18]